jgi:Tol biopolymer transport system component
VARDTNGYHDIFRVVRQTGTIQRVSVDSAEHELSGWAYRPTISNNGRYVAFQSGSEFTVTDPGSHTDIFVRDTVSGTTTLASVNSSEVPGDSDSFNASISSDGTSVVFLSLASNLAAMTNYGGYPIYLRNLRTGTTTLVSVLPSNVTADGWASVTFAPSISDDKRT